MIAQPVTLSVPSRARRVRSTDRYNTGPLFRRSRPSSALIYLAALALVALFIGPFILVILNSFKSEAESTVLSFALPQTWLFSNYVTVFEDGSLARALVNSFIVASGVAVVTIVTSAMAAFIIARRANRASRFTYKYLIAGMIAPFAFIPAISLLQTIGLYDTHLGIILTDAAGQIPFTTLLFVGFIQASPIEMDEAAILDGCNPFQLFFRVIFPTLKSVTATNIVLLFTFGWNEFQNVLFLLPSQEKWTMPMTSLSFQSGHSYNYALVCANLVVSLIPVAIVYLIMQRRIVGGMLVGSTKG